MPPPGAQERNSDTTPIETGGFAAVAQVIEEADKRLDEAYIEAKDATDALEPSLPAIEAAQEEFVKERVQPILDLRPELDAKWKKENQKGVPHDDRLASLRSALTPLLADIHPLLAPLIERALRKECGSDWPETFLPSLALSVLLAQGAADPENDPKEPFMLTIEGHGEDLLGAFLAAGELTIEGKAGSVAGHSMQGGTLTIKRDAGDWAGDSMAGGTLTVEGNAGYSAGDSMKGGTLTIEGDAGRSAGFFMQGGTLDLRGDVASFHMNAFDVTRNHGTIIWKGETLLLNGVLQPKYHELVASKVLKLAS